MSESLIIRQMNGGISEMKRDVAELRCLDRNNNHTVHSHPYPSILNEKDSNIKKSIKRHIEFGKI